MQSQDIEEKVKELTANFSQEEFIFDFLLAFGFTKMTINRLRKGNSNLASKENQLIVKQKLFYEYSSSNNLYSIIDDLKNNTATYTHKPRFIIVQNSERLLSIDTKTQETLDVKLSELHKHIDFFLPWTGKEKYIAHQENPADIKAAEKMAQIYEEIIRLNPELTQKYKNHSLNVFLTRLLFCFFAEDTGIFEDNIFSKTINNHTNDNGSDLADILGMLFEVMDKKDNEKDSYPSYIQNFPYVNGKLFTDKVELPKLNSKVRKLILECGDQNWKEINPDIFGSMFQAVSVAEVRSGLGQHYTSVPNIMKVIEPLFLNNLREEFEKADTEKKLRNLLKRIYNLKIFDPACGSGNFLIIAYKQLRILEMDIIKKIEEINQQKALIYSQLKLNQFYGIEIDDFACEIARLSLWLAEHQMNIKFKAMFGNCNPSLPLSKSGNIVCGNATRLDWKEICPQETEDEIYILGNPPYLGTRNQKDVHKDDIKYVFKSIKNYKTLDYICCWFYKAAQYIQDEKAKYAFVTTNSICQGDQVAVLWTLILQANLEIFFTYQSFNWSNNAKNNAGVTVSIIGIENKNEQSCKKIYNTNSAIEVKNINAYLIEGSNVFVNRQQKSISNFPMMIKGSIPADGGFLLLNENEYLELSSDSRLRPILKQFVGAQEVIDDIKRWCLYITDNDLPLIKNIPEIAKRLMGVYNMRVSSTKIPTQKLATSPHKFAEDRYFNEPAIIIPCTTSGNREYIPIVFLPAGPIVYASAQAIYNPPVWIFGVISSKMHMVWVQTIAGRLRTDYRYSSTLCYNTFPFPDITDKQKKIIEHHVNNILAEREKHSDKTMAELYDPEKMPQGLREAHHSLDLAIEKCYRQTPFENDEKRLEYLFKLYEIMTNPNHKPNLKEELELL